MNKGMGALLLAGLCAAEAAGAVTVGTAPLSELSVQVEYSAPARAESYDHSLLSAQQSGRVQQVAVRVGDRVAAGQLLVRLECADYELAARQAGAAQDALAARVALARQQLKRAEWLLQQRNASEELRDQRSAELRSLQAEQRVAQAAVDKSALSVSRCEVAAPFAATVTERPIAEGALADSGTPLIRLLRDRPPEVVADIPLVQLDSLRRATESSFEQAGRAYPVQLRAELPLVDARTRTRQVRLSFAADSALAGATGRLVWRGAEQQLPPQYVVSRGGELGLMLWQAGEVRFHPLAEAVEGQAVAVDLPADTQVIVEGQYGVKDGDKAERRAPNHAGTAAQ